MAKEKTAYDLYSNQSQLKWVVLVISLLIGAGSIAYTNSLVNKIREREKTQIDLYAKTLEYLANESDSRNLIFILEEIIQANSTIPVVLTDDKGTAEFYKNIPAADFITDEDERNEYLSAKITDMKAERDPIEVTLVDENNQNYGKKYIYYENSRLLVQLQYYPYIQLAVIALFGLATYAVFNYSRASEQNRVWVGLAKETAHQLGTPLSSMMAWIEYLKSKYPADENIAELDKDIERLEMITSRFSNIGSMPQLVEMDMVELTQSAVGYLQSRLSEKISFTITSYPSDQIIALANRELFGWVLENICKNAVDAMEGIGSITIKIMRISDGRVAVDIKDTGKGIPKGKVSQVFDPGFTTKRRGWGLGLTLVKRIVENYHEGKIYVKDTEAGKGTTFRIILKSPESDRISK